MADPRQELEDLRRMAELERRAGGTAPAAPAKDPSVMSELGRAAANLPSSALKLGVDTVKGIVHNQMHPVQYYKGLGTAVGNAVDVAKGGLQAVRELSPKEFQGNAPAMDRTAYDATAAKVNAAVGTPRRALKTFADNPAPAVAAVASVAVPALRATKMGQAAEAATGRAIAGTGKAIANTTGKIVEPIQAGITGAKRGNSAAKAMTNDGAYALDRQHALEASQQNTLAEQAAQHTAEAAAAAKREARLRDIAEKARKRGNEAFARQAEEQANAISPDPAIGKPRSASEIGDTIREPALANEKAAGEGMRERDDKFRAAMQEVTDANAAMGKGVSDTVAGKAIIKSSSEVARPDPIKRPTVGNGTAERQALHEEVLRALEPRELRLDPDQIAEARANGSRLVVKNGDTFKVTVPSMEDADDMARKLAKIAGGEIQGYEAISKLEASNLRKQVIAAMDEYARGTNAAVRNNWRLGKQAQEKFEKSRIGKKLVGMENGTKAPGVSSSSIQDALISGGRDAVAQAKLVAGEGPVKDALRSIVQNEVIGKNSKALENLVAPGSKWHDIVSTDGELEAALKSHIDNVRTAETAAQKADELGRRTGKYSKFADNLTGEADKYSKVAEALTGKAKTAQGLVERSAERSRDIQQELNYLRVEDPKKVGTRYKRIMDEEHKAGRISDEDHARALRLSAEAERAFKDKDQLAKWMGEASWLAGGGTLGGMIGGPAGFVIGAGAGAGARAMRRKLSNMGR